jgi:hypothetical protein
MIREGEQIKFDHVLITRQFAHLDPRSQFDASYDSPGRSDERRGDAREPAAPPWLRAGLFRRVRVTELPRTGSLARDVLVELEEPRRRPSTTAAASKWVALPPSADDGSGAIDQLDIGPARLFSAISRRNCGARIDR